MKIKNLFAILTLLALLFSLAACTPQKAPDTELEIRILTLNGTTGFGFSKLMQDTEENKAKLNYTFSVESDASNVTAALINGSADIAALPTNAASVVFNKTEGGVQVIALNTLGVLYLVGKGEDKISSFEELRGRTVYVPAQNPTFIFTYLCRANGLEVGKDIIIDNSYAQPADLRGALVSGSVDLAVLPEPMVTIACNANKDLSVFLDLTGEWNKLDDAKQLTQGCLVVRTEFAKEHKAELDAFLEEYAASVNFVKDNPEHAAQMIAAQGIFENAAVAQKALPKCNLCYIDGKEMKQILSGFLSVMAEVNMASIGGALPGDAFYYEK